MKEVKKLLIIGLKNKNDFFKIIKEYDHIKGIFFGHIHQNYFINHNNIRIYGTPSSIWWSARYEADNG